MQFSSSPSFTSNGPSTSVLISPTPTLFPSPGPSPNFTEVPTVLPVIETDDFYNNNKETVSSVLQETWFIIVIPLLLILIIIVLMEYRLRQEENDPNSQLSQNRRNAEYRRQLNNWSQNVLRTSEERRQQRRTFRDLFWSEDGSGFVRHEMKKDHIRKNVHIGVSFESD